jgi:hypothetical protein
MEQQTELLSRVVAACVVTNYDISKNNNRIIAYLADSEIFAICLQRKYFWHQIPFALKAVQVANGYHRLFQNKNVPI